MERAILAHRIMSCDLMMQLCNTSLQRRIFIFGALA